MYNSHSIKSPSLSHITSTDWDRVYEPSEDTYLLLDVLEADLEFINQKNPTIVLEVGSGSGTIVTGISSSLGPRSLYLAVDINPHACHMTQAMAVHNKTHVDVIQAHLMTPFVVGCIDMIVFNPPYVVTPAQEVHSLDALTRSWAGGKDGRQITNKFLDMLDSCLSCTGFGYLLLLKENNPHDVISILKRKRFAAEIIGQRKIRGEQLYVVRFINSSSDFIIN